MSYQTLFYSKYNRLYSLLTYDIINNHKSYWVLSGLTNTRTHYKFRIGTFCPEWRLSQGYNSHCWYIREYKCLITACKHLNVLEIVYDYWSWLSRSWKHINSYCPIFDDILDLCTYPDIVNASVLAITCYYWYHLWCLVKQNEWRQWIRVLHCQRVGCRQWAIRLLNNRTNRDQKQRCIYSILKVALAIFKLKTGNYASFYNW